MADAGSGEAKRPRVDAEGPAADGTASPAAQGAQRGAAPGAPLRGAARFMERAARRRAQPPPFAALEQRPPATPPQPRQDEAAPVAESLRPALLPPRTRPPTPFAFARESVEAAPDRGPPATTFSRCGPEPRPQQPGEGQLRPQLPAPPPRPPPQQRAQDGVQHYQPQQQQHVQQQQPAQQAAQWPSAQPPPAQRAPQQRVQPPAAPPGGPPPVAAAAPPSTPQPQQQQQEKQEAGPRWTPALRDAWALRTAEPCGGATLTAVAELRGFLSRREGLLRAAVAAAAGGPVRVPIDWQELSAELPGSAALAAAEHRPDLFFAILDFAAFAVLHPECGSEQHGPLWQQRAAGRVSPESFKRSSGWAVSPAAEGRLVCIDGIVLRASRVQVAPAEMLWMCWRCHGYSRGAIEGGKLQEPRRCACGAADLVPLRHTVAEDRQEVVIRGIASANQPDRAPPEVPVALRGDLADSAPAGSYVCVLGVVRLSRTREEEEELMQERRMRAEMQQRPQEVRAAPPYLEAHSVTVRRGGVPLEPAQKRAALLRQLAANNRGNMFHIVCNSLCPELIGHENAKAAAALALFGAPDRANAGVLLPGRVNVLLVGERAVGKSTLLRAVAAVAPRAAYVDGTDTQAVLALSPGPQPRCGLGCGAIGAAAGGALCLDELGACPGAHGVLEDALQCSCLPTVAGGPAAVPCDATLVATASPIKGVFQRGAGLAANLPPKSSKALLRRFDLAVLMLDQRADGADRLLSCLLLEMFNAGVDGVKARLLKTEGGGGGGRTAETVPVPACATDRRLPLLQRLRLPLTARGDLDGEFEALPPALLRQLIVLGRGTVPVLSRPAQRTLFECYAGLLRREGTQVLREAGREFMASLVRLAQARARVELSAEVTEEHALDVVELVAEARSDLAGPGPAAQAAAGGKRGGAGVAGKKDVMRFFQTLCSEAGRAGCDTFSVADLSALHRRLKLGADFGEMLRKLNAEGLVIKTPSGMWRVIAGGDYV